jgi:hypothetical protein
MNDVTDFNTFFVLSSHDWKEVSVKPTVRGMFYALVSLNQIKNTKSEYTSLDQHLVDWRQDETIPMDSSQITAGE